MKEQTHVILTFTLHDELRFESSFCLEASRRLENPLAHLIR